MGKQKWTEEMIVQESRKFKNKEEWREKSPGSYYAARRQNIYKELTKHMQNKTGGNFNRKYSDENIRLDALKYNSHTDWNKNSPLLFQAALRRKLVKIYTSHMLIKTTPWGYWTNEKIKELTINFKTIKQWREKSASSYMAARRLGIIKEVSKHMSILGNQNKRCIYSIKIPSQNLVYIGLTFNFNQRIQQHLDSNRFKNLIKLYGRKSLIIDQLTGYLDVKEAGNYETKLIINMQEKGWKLLNMQVGGGLGGDRTIWNEQKIIKTCEKYVNYSEWRKNEPLAYAAALNIQKKLNISILNKIGKILPKININSKESKLKGKPWTVNRRKAHSSRIINSEGKEYLDLILEDAKKYKTKTDWKKKSPGLYSAAKRLNIFELAVSHMPKFSKKKI